MKVEIKLGKTLQEITQGQLVSINRFVDLIGKGHTSKDNPELIQYIESVTELSSNQIAKFDDKHFEEITQNILKVFNSIYQKLAVVA